MAATDLVAVSSSSIRVFLRSRPVVGELLLLVGLPMANVPAIGLLAGRYWLSPRAEVWLSRRYRITVAVTFR